MASVRSTLVSEEEFLAMPETMERIELLDGEVIVSPSPTPWHQVLVGRIQHRLSAWSGATPRPVFVGLSPLDVRFAPGRILQPDVFVILDAAIALDRGPIDRVPELCVEVLSNDRVHDRVTKRFVYAAAGVCEFWVVEPAGWIERWSGKGLERPEVVSERLTSDLLPGFDLDVRALFARP